MNIINCINGKHRLLQKQKLHKSKKVLVDSISRTALRQPRSCAHGPPSTPCYSHAACAVNLKMSAAAKLYFVSVEVLANKEGIDLPRFLQKINGLLEDYSTATHVIYKFKVRGLPTFPFPRLILSIFTRPRAHGSRRGQIFSLLSKFCCLGNAESTQFDKAIVVYGRVSFYVAEPD